MARLTLHLAQPQIKAGQRPLHEIVIGIRIDQVCQGRSLIVGLDGMVQGGVNVRGTSMVLYTFLLRSMSVMVLPS